MKIGRFKSNVDKPKFGKPDEFLLRKGQEFIAVYCDIYQQAATYIDANFVCLSISRGVYEAALVEEIDVESKSLQRAPTFQEKNINDFFSQQLSEMTVRFK